MSNTSEAVIENYQNLIPLTQCSYQTLQAHEDMMLCWGLLKQAEKFDGLGNFDCSGCIMSKQEINKK